MRHTACYGHLALTLVLSGLCMTSAEAEIRWGAGFQTALIATESDEEREVDKKGLGLAGTLGASWIFDDAATLTIGLGLESRQVKGDTQSFTQEVKTQGSFLSAGYRWALGAVELGPQIVLTRGKAASLRADDADSIQTVLAFGPELAKRWTMESGELLAYCAVTQDLNVDHQSNRNFTVGLQFWLKDSPQQATDTPETKE